MPGKAWREGDGHRVVEEVMIKRASAQGNVPVPQAWQGHDVLLVAAADTWRVQSHQDLVDVYWRSGWSLVLQPKARTIRVGAANAGEIILVCLVSGSIDPPGAQE